jgi:UDP-2,3-diacylglucosamine hydrolase
VKTGRSLFVADLHLTDERPLASGHFFRFLQEEAVGADALYILGDLFETWVGDDHDEQIALDAARHLKSLVESGTPVFFMHGNRDFMLAERYAAKSGMTLLADPTLIDLYGVPTLLMHGDTLCTDDTAYLKFRRRIRHPWTQALLARLPRGLRQRLARRVRGRSESAKADKTAEIMDVNSGEVERMLSGQQARRLIHGHTHRPARHTLQLDGHVAERWVVPDWYARWGYVACDPAGCTLVVNPL